MATSDAQPNPLPSSECGPWHDAESPPDRGKEQKPPTIAADTEAHVVSSLRAETSRQNGRKSNGPKTTEGKNRSRLNALKHGVRSETLLLEAGSEEENAALQVLRVRLEQQFLPRTVEEQLLLETAVHALWQKQRGLRFEVRELRQDLVFHGPVMDRILRYGTSADKRFFRSLAELKRLQGEDADGPLAK